VRSLHTLDLEPGIKLLGFKDRSELVFEDNVRHSLFIYPDEETYAGSRRTFTALLSSMVKKGKIGLVRALTRRNASPSFCALLPQEEGEGEGWAEPSGFHLITLPYADDIRAAPIEEGFLGGLPHSPPPPKLALALSSARVPQRATSLLMQPNHLFPSSRSGTALTRLILTLTPVGTFPHFSGAPPNAHDDVSIGLPLCAARGNCIPRGVRSSFVRGSHPAKERHDPQEGRSIDQGVDEAFEG
jgi:hypothetical protein